ncbi:MAG: PAS domain S-box protein, partial [Promethearchaeota archaeon]
LGKEYNFAFARDITERKKAERTLRRERDRAQQYLDTAGVLIDALDTEGNITLINKKGCEVLGYNNETELLGKNWIDTFRSEEDREMVKELYKAVMTGEMDLVEEYEDSLITKNGEKRYISWHHSLIRDDMGTITGILSSGNDITNQLQANKALRESEQKFRVLAESALVGMAIIQDYQLKYINDAMITIVGHPREEVLKWTSKEFLETIHPKDLSIVQNQLQLKQTGMKEEVIPQYHFRLITATEEIRCVNNFSSTVIYEGKPANLVTLIDITEQKQREEENLRLLAELKKTNMELRDFVSIASHDLKAPLRGIRNLAEILVTDHADKIDEEGKNILNLLINRVTRMYGLIEGILAYSRIGRISEEFIEVNLNELLLEVIDLLAPPENIKIEFVSELPTIWAQKTCILQIFQNLLDNAIKFNDKPEGNIQINFEDKGEDWEFSVNDNGSGIEARYFEKIFQIFQTLPTRDEQENIGIGLTIVQRIIEMYGGTIWVDSTVGSGSTFSFTLPKSV